MTAVTGIEAFRSVTRERFLGRPKIVERSLESLRDGQPNAPLEPILAGKYQARIWHRGAAAYHNGKHIATYMRGSPTGWLWTHPDYRRNGIAVELIYQVAVRYGRALPSRQRTAAVQAVCEKVWTRIQAELAAPK